MITNKTKGSVLCKTLEVADTPWKKTKGLMFRSGLPEGHALLMTFNGNNSPGIWMLGMRFPIDIIFLDSDRQVTRIVESAKPLGLSWKTWKVFFPPGPVSYILELRAGSVSASRTKEGDILDIHQ